MRTQADHFHLQLNVFSVFILLYNGRQVTHTHIKSYYQKEIAGKKETNSHIPISFISTFIRETNIKIQ